MRVISAIQQDVINLEVMVANMTFLVPTTADAEPVNTGIVFRWVAGYMGTFYNTFIYKRM